MQHPMLTFIIKYPNDCLQMATQQHLKNHVIFQCSQCQSNIIGTRNKNEVICNKCKTSNPIQKIKNPCSMEFCNGSVQLVKIGGNILRQCNKCHNSVLVSIAL